MAVSPWASVASGGRRKLSVAASKTVCTVKTAVEKAVVAVYLKGRPVNTPSLLHPILKM
jgi:hypothetical protein